MVLHTIPNKDLLLLPEPVSSIVHISDWPRISDIGENACVQTTRSSHIIASMSPALKHVTDTTIIIHKSSSVPTWWILSSLKSKCTLSYLHEKPADDTEPSHSTVSDVLTTSRPVQPNPHDDPPGPLHPTWPLPPPLPDPPHRLQTRLILSPLLFLFVFPLRIRPHPKLRLGRLAPARVARDRLVHAAHLAALLDPQILERQLARAVDALDGADAVERGLQHLVEARLRADLLEGVHHRHAVGAHVGRAVDCEDVGVVVLGREKGC